MIVTPKLIEAVQESLSVPTTSMQHAYLPQLKSPSTIPSLPYKRKLRSYLEDETASSKMRPRQTRPRSKPQLNKTIRRETWNCDVCGKVFENKHYMSQHRNGVHSEKTLPCKLCDRKFSTKYRVTRHLKQVHQDYGMKRLRCGLCQISMKSSAELDAHDAMFHPRPESTPTPGTGSQARSKQLRRSLTCKACGRMFTTKEKLAVHVLAHRTTAAHAKAPEGTLVPETQPVSCEQCKEFFQTDAEYEVHIQNYHQKWMSEVGGVKCRMCKRSFTSDSDLSDHQFYVHAKPYECTLCKSNKSRNGKKITKTFPTRYSYEVHCNKKSHQNREKQLFASRREWRCAICDDDFKNETHLLQHQRTHDSHIAKVKLSNWGYGEVKVSALT